MKYTVYNPTEIDELIELFTKTFGDSEGKQEGELIGGLIRTLTDTTPDNDLFVFVAREQEQIVASILFTRLAFEEEHTSFLMAPVAVATDFQGKGVGQALIRHGLNEMQTLGVKLAFTYGDPNFYTKVGFKQISEEQFKAPLKLNYPHGWMMCSLADDSPTSLASKPTCVTGFNQPELW